MKELEILDPTAEQEATPWSLAAPLEAGRAIRVGVLDITKPRGELFLDELEQRLVAHGHTVERYRKVTMTRPAVDELVGEMVRTCEASVVALAD